MYVISGSKNNQNLQKSLKILKILIRNQFWNQFWSLILKLFSEFLESVIKTDSKSGFEFENFDCFWTH